MPCLICGAGKTVRSHVIPKAFAHEIKDGATHAVAASRHHPTVKTSPGGMFNNQLLCAEHEGMTAAPDKYAIEFVRRIAGAWDGKRVETLLVANPQPHLLRSFALLTIWREVHFSQVSGVTLGPYESPIRDFLFRGAPPPPWPVFVQRTNFVLDGRAVDYNLHPYRIRFSDRTGWMMATAGVSFIVVTDKRGIQPAFIDLRADVGDPATVTVPSPLPFTEVGALKVILAGMAASR